VLFVALAACHHEEKHDDGAKREGARTMEEAGTPAQAIVLAYESAATCDVRSQSIVRAAANKRLLASMTCGTHHVERLDTKECDAVTTPGATCIAFARRDGDKMAYYLVKQPDGAFLVDIRATEMVTRLGEFTAQSASTQPMIVRARVQQGRLYEGPFRDKKDTHVALRVKWLGGEPETPELRAYMPRSNASAQQLEDIAKGAGSHELTMVLSHVAGHPSLAVVEKLLSTNLFETDAEDAFEAGAR
jgi:hypothetical protein